MVLLLSSQLELMMPGDHEFPKYTLNAAKAESLNS